MEAAKKNTKKKVMEEAARAATDAEDTADQSAAEETMRTSTMPKIPSIDVGDSTTEVKAPTPPGTSRSVTSPSPRAAASPRTKETTESKGPGQMF